MNWFPTHKMPPLGKFKKRTLSWVPSPTIDGVGHEGVSSCAWCYEPLEVWPIREAKVPSGFPGRMVPNNLTESGLKEVGKRHFVL